MKSIRERLSDIQGELIASEGDIAPSRAREMLIYLTGLSGNCATESRVADAEYNRVLLRLLNGEEAANRATIRAKDTPEYARMREAEDTEKLASEMIRSLKKVLTSIEVEMRNV